MRLGRVLLAGMGWAAPLGGIALCVLVFLSAYVAFQGDRHGVGSRDDAVVELPSVPEAEVPAVPLARPPGLAADESEGGAAPTPTARAVIAVVGTEVGRVSPAAGLVIVQTGDTAAGVVDAIARPRLRRRRR
jgi:hypothetical protein